MQRHSRRGLTTVLCHFFFYSLLLAATSASAATSYLQELEAEAAATDEAESNTTQSSKPGWSDQQPTGTGETIESGLAKPQFEEALKSRFYGSYLFYSTLNDDKQQTVYKEYTKNNDIEHLRAVIQSEMTN